MSIFQSTAGHDAGDTGDVGEISRIGGCVVRYSWRIGSMEKAPRETSDCYREAMGFLLSVFVRLLQQIVFIACIERNTHVRRAPVRKTLAGCRRPHTWHPDVYP